MKHRQHYLTAHAAHVLAAKLRERGVVTTGRDVLHWPPGAVIGARLWLEAVESGVSTLSFREFMGDQSPPPSQQSWPHLHSSSRHT
jgi:hypothetical protein